MMSLKLLRYYIGRIARKVLPQKICYKIKVVENRYHGNRMKKERTFAISHYGDFDVKELEESLKSVGIHKDGALLVHSSFNRFYNFLGTAKDILSILAEIVGARGTLLMPAFPLTRTEGPYFFDVNKAPAQTGILCELLRRKPGVKRSLNPLHSTCAIGPLSEWLLSEHHLDPYTCGRKSPFFKMVECNGQILGLGLPPGYTTFLHIVEDVDPETFPRHIYINRPVVYTVLDENGQKLSVDVYLRNQKITTTMKLERVTRHLTKEAHRVFSIHGVPVFIANAKLLFEELCILRDRGIVLYD